MRAEQEAEKLHGSRKLDNRSMRLQQVADMLDVEPQVVCTSCPCVFWYAAACELACLYFHHHLS